MLLSFLLVPALLPAADDPAKDAERLQGTWNVVSFEAPKKRPSDEELKQMRVVFEGDTMTLHTGKRAEGGKFTLDPSKDPKVMNLTLERDSKTARFIYQLAGDELKLCWRKPGKDRPEKFTAEGTDGLMILRRAK